MIKDKSFEMGNQLEAAGKADYDNHQPEVDVDEFAPIWKKGLGTAAP